jgi:hypothetical protein
METHMVSTQMTLKTGFALYMCYLSIGPVPSGLDAIK